MVGNFAMDLGPEWLDTFYSCTITQRKNSKTPQETWNAWNIDFESASVAGELITS